MLRIEKGKVLFAEDNPDLRLGAQLAFEKSPCELVTAQDGLEAILEFTRALVMERPFDVLILDAAMPRKNGFAAALAIRQIERDSLGDRQPCRIAIITAHDRTARINSLLKKIDAAGYLLKPGGMLRLLDHIPSLLNWKPGDPMILDLEF